MENILTGAKNKYAVKLVRNILNDAYFCSHSASVKYLFAERLFAHFRVNPSISSLNLLVNKRHAIQLWVRHSVTWNNVNTHFSAVAIHTQVILNHFILIISATFVLALATLFRLATQNLLLISAANKANVIWTKQWCELIECILLEHLEASNEVKSKTTHD